MFQTECCWQNELVKLAERQYELQYILDRENSHAAGSMNW